MDQRPDIEEMISWLQDRGYYSDQIVHHEIVDGQEATTDDLEIEPPVATALEQRGISNLYTHQVRAIQAVREGYNTVVATPTASGKTLTYTVPALERGLEGAGKTLYVAPYRALINDQEQTFREVTSELRFGESVDIAVQTGETETSERRAIKQRQPDVLLTTIDQIHLSLIPFAHGHNHWRWLFQQLETVVLDEVHMYRGYFGSHASLVLRRLNRLLDHYDTDPEYVCCSATIGNPVEHAAAVTAQPEDSFTLVNDDRSASGDRHWLFWNPPLKEETNDSASIDDPAVDPDGEIQAGHNEESPIAIAASTNGSQEDSHSRSNTDNRQASPISPPAGQSVVGPDERTVSHHDEVAGGERRSQHIESVRLFCDLVARGYQTLVFTSARQGAEQYANWADKELRSWGHHDLADDIYAYHAALDGERRQELEMALRKGEARGVWSTNALELGIDIGTLDVVLLDGYPGTSMSTFQRAGRAGRGEDSCLVVLVGADNPLDQYLLRDPSQLFESGAEQATVNPSNDAILPDHVVCAASDHYLSPDDEEYFGPDLPSIVTDLEATERLRRVDGDRIRWNAVEDNVQWETNIRSIDEREITLIDRNRDEHLGTLEYSAALRDAHPDAIYTHQKQSYRVAELNLERDRAYFESVETSAYTRPLREKEITIEDTVNTETVDYGGVAFEKTLARMTVADSVTGYLHYTHPNDESPAEQTFDKPLPPATVETTGLFFTVPSEVEASITAQTEEQDEYLSALHAIEHALISLYPREVLCDRADIGGLSIVAHPQTVRGTIFVHDIYPGGAGYSASAYEQLEGLLEQTLELVKGCSCEEGCPSCIHSPHCGNANRNLDKVLSVDLLDAILN
ncbi:DEAD/DEAH box helicase [Halosolutus halophilus]|uniref:DEAD/DEAH box helicase n=1 Tax=Halosolutus halophilus TaxID=1552990 RepID=UPI0022351923|nr:DEAD/DEAH box helicase [Halosolutus halophilus]